LNGEAVAEVKIVVPREAATALTEPIGATTLLEQRLKAIFELCRRSEQYVNGDLSFEKFRPALSWYRFDDEDDQGRWDLKLAVKDLAQELQTEYLFYVRWAGEAARGNPKVPGWLFGRCEEPYGWIDKTAFHRLFNQGFRQLNFLPIPDDPG